MKEKEVFGREGGKLHSNWNCFLFSLAVLISPSSFYFLSRQCLRWASFLFFLPLFREASSSFFSLLYIFFLLRHDHIFLTGLRAQTSRQTDGQTKRPKILRKKGGNPKVRRIFSQSGWTGSWLARQKWKPKAAAAASKKSCLSSNRSSISDGNSLGWQLSGRLCQYARSTTPEEMRPGFLVRKKGGKGFFAAAYFFPFFPENTFRITNFV